MSSKPRPEENASPPTAVAAFRLEAFLPYRLSVASNRVSRAFARRYAAEFGLSIPEWRVLAVLGSYAPCSSNEIVERTAMDKAKVSRAVAGLVAAGLVERGDHAADQRLISLAFSPQGRRVYEAIVPRARAIEAELLEGLTGGERRELARLLGHLLARAESLGADSEARLDGD